jgi:hypothetical protein
MVYEKLTSNKYSIIWDPDRVSALLGFHALTGCDTTGKFAGHTNANESILKALASLGT